MFTEKTQMKSHCATSHMWNLKVGLTKVESSSQISVLDVLRREDTTLGFAEQMIIF